MHRFIGISAAAAALTLAVSPATAAQKLGARTQAPEQVLAQMGEGSWDAELQRAIAAASAFPLGSLQNPVRVGGPDGQRNYLARLQCADGSRPSVGAKSSAGVGGFGSVVDRFELSCRAAAPAKAEVMMDMYHAEHKENRAPAGFAIAR